MMAVKHRWPGGAGGVQQISRAAQRPEIRGGWVEWWEELVRMAALAWGRGGKCWFDCTAPHSRLVVVKADSSTWSGDLRVAVSRSK